MHNNDINRIIEKYEVVRNQRMDKLVGFQSNHIPYLVSLSSPASFYCNCNTVEDSFEANIRDFDVALDFPSDTLPFLEPWFGTGAYAEAFGCEYMWRQGDSPACHYKFRKIEEIENIDKPAIKDGKIFKMILEAISFFKEKTRDRLPICVTDTQSAHDTATLVLDAVEVYMASYTAPETLNNFLRKINELIIDFTKAQISAIGTVLASPGHIMSCSSINGYGLSISDDNLAVSSPEINSKVLLKYDNEVGIEFGGLALHSCGDWSHTMPFVSEFESIKMIDCAISVDCDPTPNQPEAVREAFKGTGIIVQARIGSDIDSQIDLVKRIWSEDIRLIIKIDGKKGECRHQYEMLNDCLRRLYDV